MQNNEDSTLGWRTALLAFACLGVLSLWVYGNRPVALLERGCLELSAGSSLDDAALALPMDFYRSGCCSGSRQRCGEMPVCDLFPTLSGPLAYSCEGQEQACDFLWQYEEHWCLVTANAITGKIIEVDWRRLAL